tara:strand:- start:5459 stop:7036 length:1578 start_codon:yes stop_codon:yes gene_type:complete
MASVADIEPLSTEFDVPGTESKSVVEKEITALGKVIFEKASVGLKSATRAVVSNVPQMIQELTQEIESGSIQNFNSAINKLNILIDKLGINLRSYDTKLADAVDKFRGNQQKLQQDLQRLREDGIKAEINERGTGIKFLTRQEIVQREKEYKERERIIADEKQKRSDLVQTIENTNRSDKENIQARKDLKKSIVDEQKLRDKNAEEGEILRSTTADTGRDMGGFGKLAELKEAFMIIPDTINEVAGGFAQFGKSLMSGFKQFLFAPLKTIGRLFKTIGNIFRSARALIALKVLAVLAAFQFFVEKIDFIKEQFDKVFVGMKNAFQGIKDFLIDIVDWFRNSAVGRFFNLDDEAEARDEKAAMEGTGKYQSLDDGFNDAIDQQMGTGTAEMATNDPIRPFYDKESKQVIQPDNPNYFEIKKKNLNTSKQMLGSDGRIVNIVNEPKSLLAEREVVGDNMADGTDTSEALKFLQSEAGILEKPVVTNIQNNSNVTSQNSSGTTISGFVDHEPDTSFKYVRKDNGDQYI